MIQTRTKLMNLSLPVSQTTEAVKIMNEEFPLLRIALWVVCRVSFCSCVWRVEFQLFVWPNGDGALREGVSDDWRAKT